MIGKRKETFFFAVEARFYWYSLESLSLLIDPPSRYFTRLRVKGNLPVVFAQRKRFKKNLLLP